MDAIKLDVCAFCGSQYASAKRDQSAYIAGHDWIVLCQECGACGPNRASEEDAVAAWNKRPRQDALFQTAHNMENALTTAFVGFSNLISAKKSAFYLSTINDSRVEYHRVFKQENI